MNGAPSIPSLVTTLHRSGEGAVFINYRDSRNDFKISLKPRKDSSTTVDVRQQDSDEGQSGEFFGLGLSATPGDRTPITLVSRTLPPFPTFTTPDKSTRPIDLRPRFRSQKQSEPHRLYFATEVDPTRFIRMTAEEQVLLSDNLCYTPSPR